jgi:phosphonate transport system substrate-binding protein
LQKLYISTCMAPNSEFLIRDLAPFLSQRLSGPVEALLDIPWQQRERRLDAGEIGLCWICGLPYVRKADLNPAGVIPLVAPVMKGARYQGKPVYYSDVVVRRDSPFKKLEDLRGTTWSYNEPGSHSGYNVVRYALARRGERSGFFGRVIASGAHQNSLQMILNREIDASAIDSTVLELELLRDPDLPTRIRIIDTFGPSPIPPWVTAAGLPEEIRAALRAIFLNMARDPQGRVILDKALISHFVPVTDQDYDPIRMMDQLAQCVSLA